MTVTQVSIRPTDAANLAGRPALTPELLAATGARYSRSNEGLAAILAKINPENPDASVERIFKFVDYGHASIADMAPVALFIDNVSLWLAYWLWTLCPTAGGQESSTRYIRLDADGLVPPEVLGISGDVEKYEWRGRMSRLFDAYESAVIFWDAVAAAHPELLRLPPDLLADTSDKAQKTVARLRRNFAFDRARYLLPVATATNVMLVMSARAWVSVCQNLLSCGNREATLLGDAVRDELALAAPRLLKHARPVETLTEGLADEFGNACRIADGVPNTVGETLPTAFLEVSSPLDAQMPQFAGALFAQDLRHHDNRYGHIGPTLRRTTVRFGWHAVALAEIRDLNRHRTGTKYCPAIPVGFYGASDQVPAKLRDEYAAPLQVGIEATRVGLNQMQAYDSTYMYHLPLGAQFFFEHTTTADKFLYEAELRTGVGAHYRYARHLHDALALWYEKFPETRGLVLEGSAEPE